MLKHVKVFIPTLPPVLRNHFTFVKSFVYSLFSLKSKPFLYAGIMNKSSPSESRIIFIAVNQNNASFYFLSTVKTKVKFLTTSTNTFLQLLTNSTQPTPTHSKTPPKLLKNSIKTPKLHKNSKTKPARKVPSLYTLLFAQLGWCAKVDCCATSYCATSPVLHTTHCAT